MYGIIYDPGMETYDRLVRTDLDVVLGQLYLRFGSISPSQLANQSRERGITTVWGGIDPGELHLRPQVVGLVGVWNLYYHGVGAVPAPGATGSRRCPGVPFSPRGLHEPQPTIYQLVGLGFPPGK